MLSGVEKREFLAQQAALCPHRYFVETGSADGNTTVFLAETEHFDGLYSVELVYNFYAHCVRSAVHLPSVNFIYGDSAEVLQWLLPVIAHPCMFWLDAHYNGEMEPRDNPIIAELEHIVYSRIHSGYDHWIFIDDVREFGVNPEYPQLGAVNKVLGGCEWDISIQDDIMRIIPVSLNE